MVEQARLLYKFHPQVKYQETKESHKMTQSGQHHGKDRLIFLRQWVGAKVTILTREKWQYTGTLTNIVFDNTRLMYIMLDDKQCLNYDHIVEISVNK